MRRWAIFTARRFLAGWILVDRMDEGTRLRQNGEMRRSSLSSSAQVVLALAAVSCEGLPHAGRPAPGVDEPDPICLAITSCPLHENCVPIAGRTAMTQGCAGTTRPLPVAAGKSPVTT
jgi:hypothetical protein